MKVLVCRVSEKTYVGFDTEEVAGVGQFNIHEVPQKQDNLLGAIVYNGKIYSAVALNTLLGGKKIKIFVALKKGFAVGVYDMDGIYNVEEFMKVEGVLKENFEKAFMLNKNVVYLLEDKFFSNLPRIPQDIEIDIKTDESLQVLQKKEKESMTALLVEVDSEKFVLPKRLVKEVQSVNPIGKFYYGNIHGFTSFEGNPVPIVWKKPVKSANWVIVLEDVAIPCSRIRTEEVIFERSSEGVFAFINGVRYKVYNEGNIGELLRWI
ncbi:MAG: hypothetical protein J7L34_07855 [Thermotogaceae bacterium]|nr:hypothetical protein [Thermotogaceae bacterium]